MVLVSRPVVHRERRSTSVILCGFIHLSAAMEECHKEKQGKEKLQMSKEGQKS